MAEHIHMPGRPNVPEVQILPLSNEEEQLFKNQSQLAKDNLKMAEQNLRLAEAEVEKANKAVNEIARRWGTKEWSNKESILKILADDSYTIRSERLMYFADAPNYIKSDKDLMLKVIRKFGQNVIHLLRSELEKDPEFQRQANIRLQELAIENEKKNPREFKEYRDAPMHMPGQK